ncbi:hypothetical protein J6W32_05100 [bacterium]|nr:hypothetical protein [bacterium]MBP5783477.1 hypothetical protein [bacterium]MBP5783931.1 hypothetical protein [bacterium]
MLGKKPKEVLASLLVSFLFPAQLIGLLINELDDTSLELSSVHSLIGNKETLPFSVLVMVQKPNKLLKPDKLSPKIKFLKSDSKVDAIWDNK